MMKRLFYSLIAICLAAVMQTQATADVVFTTQTAGTHNWTDSANWLNGIVPQATETDRVILQRHRPASGGQVRTVLLDRANQVLQGGFAIAARSGSNGEVGLTLDLNTHPLVIDGGVLQAMQAFDTSSQVGDPTVTITNGDLQLGTVANATDFSVGESWVRGNTRMLFTASAVLEATNIDDFYVAGNPSEDTRFAVDNMRLDLSSATINSGAASNTLDIGNNLYVSNAINQAGSSIFTRNATLLLPGTLTELSVGNDLILGQSTNIAGHDSIGEIDMGGGSTMDVTVDRSLLLARGGAGDGTLSNLPDTLNLTVGSALVRGEQIAAGLKDLITDADSVNQQADGSLDASAVTGGTFNAWIETLSVGRNTTDSSLLDPGAGTPGATGLLDLSGLTTATLDVSDGAYVGVGENATGTLRLNGGTFTTDNLDVGTSGGSGDVNLDGTTLNVASTLTIGTEGLVTVLNTDLDLGNATLAMIFDSSANVGFLDVSGELNIGNATLSLTNLDATDPNVPVLILAEYGSLTGTDFADVQGLGDYTLDLNYQGQNQIALIIPEPTTLALCVLGAIGLVRRRPMGRDRG